jgi:DNA-binding NarL/FixJ family response regulator
MQIEGENQQPEEKHIATKTKKSNGKIKAYLEQIMKKCPAEEAW